MHLCASVPESASHQERRRGLTRRWRSNRLSAARRGHGAPLRTDGSTCLTIYEYTFTRRRIAESPATVRSPSDTLPILRDLIGDRETERLAVLWLDTKHHVIGSDPASCPRSVLALECESPERESARGAASARMAA